MSTFAVNFFNNTYLPAVGSSLTTPSNTGTTYLSNQGTCGQVGYNLLFTSGIPIDYTTVNSPEDCFVIASSSYDILVRASFNEVSHINQDRLYAILDLENSYFRGDSAISIGIHSSPSGVANLVVQCMGSESGNPQIAILHGTTRIFPGVPHDFKVEFRGGSVTLKVDDIPEPCYFKFSSAPSSSSVYSITQDIGYYSYGSLGYLNHLTLGSVAGNIYPFYGCINKLEISKDIPAIVTTSTIQTNSNVRDTVTSVPDRALRILDTLLLTKELLLNTYGVSVVLKGVPITDPITGITAPPVNIITTPNTIPPTVPTPVVNTSGLVNALLDVKAPLYKDISVNKKELVTIPLLPSLGYLVGNTSAISVNRGVINKTSYHPPFSVITTLYLVSSNLKSMVQITAASSGSFVPNRLYLSVVNGAYLPGFYNEVIITKADYIDQDVLYGPKIPLGYGTLSLIIERLDKVSYLSFATNTIVSKLNGLRVSLFYNNVKQVSYEVALNSNITDLYGDLYLLSPNESLSDIAQTTEVKAIASDKVALLTNPLLKYTPTFYIDAPSNTIVTPTHNGATINTSCNGSGTAFTSNNDYNSYTSTTPYFNCSEDYTIEAVVNINGADNLSGVATIADFQTPLGFLFSPRLYLISSGVDDNNIFFTFPNGSPSKICTAYINHILDGEHTIRIVKTSGSVKLSVDGVLGTTDTYYEPDLGTDGICSSFTLFRSPLPYQPYFFNGCITSFLIALPLSDITLVAPEQSYYCTLLQNFPDFTYDHLDPTSTFNIHKVLLDESFDPSSLLGSTSYYPEHDMSETWLTSSGSLQGYYMEKPSPFIRLDSSADVNDFSIQLYIKLSSIQTAMLVEVYDMSPLPSAIKLAVVNNYLTMTLGTDVLSSSIAIPTDTWTHVCFSCYSDSIGSPSSTWKMFINGSMASSSNVVMVYHEVPDLYFRVHVASNLVGNIDSVMISTSNTNSNGDVGNVVGPLIGVVPKDDFLVTSFIGTPVNYIDETLNEDLLLKSSTSVTINDEKSEEIDDSIISVSRIGLPENTSKLVISESLSVSNIEYKYEVLSDSVSLDTYQNLSGSVYTTAVIDSPILNLDTIFKDKDGEWVESFERHLLYPNSLSTNIGISSTSDTVSLTQSDIITDSKLVTYSITVSDQFPVKATVISEASGSRFITIRDYLFSLSSLKNLDKKVRSSNEAFFARDLAISNIGDVVPYDPRFSDVLLLMHMDSSESELFLDSSFGKNVSNGDATISDLSTLSKFGDGSYSANQVHGISMLNGTVPNDMLESFTISAQIFPIVLYGGEQVIISKGDSVNTTGTYFKLSIYDGEVTFSSGRGVDEVYLYSSLGSYNINEWSHVAVTFDVDTGRYRLLVNGTAHDSTIAAPMEASDPLDPRAYKIGMDFNNSQPFQGLIDEVIVVKRNLYPGTSYLPPTARYAGPVGSKNDFLEDNITLFTALASSYEVSNEVLEAVYLLLEFIDKIPEVINEEAIENLLALGDGTFEGVALIFENVEFQDVIDSLLDALEYLVEVSIPTDSTETTTSFGNFLSEESYIQHSTPDSVYRDWVISDALKIVDLIRLATAIHHKEHLYTTDTLDKYRTLEDILSEFVQGVVGGESFLRDPATNRVVYSFIGDSVSYNELMSTFIGVLTSYIGNSKDDLTILESLGISVSVPTTAIVNNKWSDKILLDFIAQKNYETSMDIVEVAKALDFIYSIFSTIINESLVAADTSSYLSNIVDKLQEYLSTSDSTDSSGDFSSIILNVISILTSINIGYSKDLQEVLTSLSSFIDSFAVDEYVTEQYLLAELLSFVLMDLIAEKATVSLDMQQFIERSAALNSLVTSSSSLAVTFLEALQEEALPSDSLVSFTKAISNLSEIISSNFELLINSTLSSVSIDVLSINHEVYCNFTKDLIETFNTLSEVLCSFYFESTEILSITDSLDRFGKVIAEAIEFLSVVSTFTEESVGVFIVSDALSLEDSDSNILSASNLLTSPFVIKLVRSGSNISDTYLAYALSPESKSVTTYSNFSFDDCTKFGNKYLFCNSTGLYEYGGTSDDGDKIRSTIKTFAYDFKSSNLKQVPSVYLGITSSGSYVLKVSTDGKGRAYYKLNKKTKGLNTQKVDIGKGVIGRYFQFELISDDTEFNIDQVEFYSLELKRKL